MVTVVPPTLPGNKQFRLQEAPTIDELYMRIPSLGILCTKIAGIEATITYNEPQQSCSAATWLRLECKVEA